MSALGCVLACALTVWAEEPKGSAVAGRVAAVTVYQGQARVVRELPVPEGDGAIDLVVGPLPEAMVEGSLFAEGADGLRVISARAAVRAAVDDAQAARERKAAVERLEDEESRLRRDADSRTEDLQFLRRLEGFSGSALTSLTDRGRLDTESVVALSRFVMETRDAKAKAEVDLQRRVRENAAALAEARSRLAGTGEKDGDRVRDAVLRVRRSRPGAGVLRVGYLVNRASWTPRYRLRGAGDEEPVVLEYLATVVQQTGEDWPGAAVSLSTATPSLDAAPPELLPLKATPWAGATIGRSLGADDETSRRILAELRKPIDIHFPEETPLEDVLKYIRRTTSGPGFPEGLPIYLDPNGLSAAEKTITSPVAIDIGGTPLATTLHLLLQQLDLAYLVQGGVLRITSRDSEEFSMGDERDDMRRMAGMGGMGGGMGGMGGGVVGKGRMVPAPAPILNLAAADAQARELQVTEGVEAPKEDPKPTVREAPTVSFKVAGELDVPSRAEPQSVELARLELPAEYYAKAVPVLTPRVYRLAKLTNAGGFPLLPGEVDVLADGEFVGRMPMPLVAAGEPFVAGFGVDPQLQVARRLVQKSRTIQGGNQILAYEFRIALRNFRKTPVKFEVWDRIPRPEGEAAAVSLAKTSAELSHDPMYQRTARLDNLLRWDVDLPAEAVGEKTVDLNYEFRVEYARDLPPLRFESGGLGEMPIGGGATRRTEGTGGGFQ